ncbi:MAG: aminoacyl-tRNA hydrolase [Hyphomicrobiales bacterium]|nr:aminoacyl-tRNA hydrolase [Hyphomicrobiales bacterium]
MKLVVGLGNPGAKYAGNRHNVGFMAVDRIAARHGFSPWRKKFQGLASEGTLGDQRVTLLKPDTYMNESGRAVGEALRFLKVPIGDLIVIYDEIDLAPGKLKVKTGGGNAGHNGLRSISAHLENEYVRVRIGVGHPGHKDLVAGYVLHDFAKAEQVWLAPLLDAIADAAPRLAAGDQARFMTDVARLIGDATEPPTSAPAPRKAADQQPAGKSPGRHPAGERMGKRQSALAQNLRRWMDRKGSADDKE